MSFILIRPAERSLHARTGISALFRFIRSAYLWLTDPFRRIPFRLWRASLFATVVTTLIVVPLITLAFWNLYASQLQGIVSGQTAEIGQNIKPYFRTDAPKESEVATFLNNGALTLAGDIEGNNPLSFMNRVSVLTAVTDVRGNVIACAPGIPLIAGRTLESQLSPDDAVALNEGIQEGSAGADGIFDHHESEFDVAAAMPMLDAHNKLAGVLYVRASPSRAWFPGDNSGAAWTAYWLCLVTLCVTIPAGAIVGLFVSGIYGRKLSRRIRELSRSVEAWGSGDLAVIPVRSRDEIGCLAKSLNRASQDMEQRLQGREQRAVTEERGRMARILHDTAKHHAYAAAAQIEAARSVLGESEEHAAVFMANAQNLTDKVQEDLTSIVHGIQPEIIADAGKPLSAILTEYAASWSEMSGIVSEVSVPDDLHESSAILAELIPIVQEAFANVARHSEAARIKITVARHDDGLTHVTILDDGQGFDPIFAKRGMGLRSMRDHAAALPNGRLAITAARGKGVVVRIAFASDAGTDGDNGVQPRQAAGDQEIHKSWQQ